MTSNLKKILSAVGIAALLASPAMAKPVHHRHAAPPTVYAPEQSPYMPSAPAYRDFQDSPGRLG
jgi:hypothetical protein